MTRHMGSNWVSPSDSVYQPHSPQMASSAWRDIWLLEDTRPVSHSLSVADLGPLTVNKSEKGCHRPSLGLVPGLPVGFPLHYLAGWFGGPPLDQKACEKLGALIPTNV